MGIRVEGLVRWWVVVLLLGLSVSIAGALLLRQSVRQAEESHFDRLVERAHAELGLRLESAGMRLQAVHATFAMLGRAPDADEFQRLLGLLERDRDAAGTIVLSFAERVPHEHGDVGYVLRHMQVVGHGGRGFTDAIGTDLASDPQRRALIQRAERSGRIEASGPIPILFDDRPMGLVAYASLGGDATAMPPTGLLVTAIAYDDLFGGLVGPSSGVAGLQVTDLGDDGLPRLAFREGDLVAGKRVAVKRIEFGGRSLDVAFHQAERPLAGPGGLAAWTLGGAGSALSLLGAFVVWRAGWRRDQALLLANRHAQALEAGQALLRQAGEVAGIGVWSYDPQAGTLHWSEETRKLHDLASDHQPDVAQALCFYLQPGREVLVRAFDRLLEHGVPYDLELEALTATGRRIWVRTVGGLRTTSDGRAQALGTFQDITGHKQLALAVEEQRSLLQTTLDSIADGVLTTDAQGRVLWLNPVAARMLGTGPAQARGRPVTEVMRLVTEGEPERVQPSPVMECLRLAAPQVMPGDVLLLPHGEGPALSVEDSAAPVLAEDGTVLGAVMIFRDVSERRRLAREIDFRARHDALTGLLNRTEFEDRLRRRLARGPGRSVLLFVDLDHFKVVNDTCGHAAGDRLLVEVAQLLASRLRGDDVLARFGGDEFAVILDDCGIDDAQRIAESFRERVDSYRFHASDGRRFQIGASIGLVGLDEGWAGVESVLQAADEACYLAKRGGRNRVALSGPQQPSAAPLGGPAHWGSLIEQALDGDGFELFGQRIAPLAPQQRQGLRCEVLLRLRDVAGSLALPGEFMPAAERYQLTGRIDRWVLQRVVELLAGQAAAGITRIGINLSGASVGDPLFHEFAIGLIQQGGIDSSRLCLEITETAAIANMAEASAFIDRLRGTGVQVALDDFGAGMSSFSYLRSLNVDILKIDGQFVRGMIDNPLDEVAVRCFVEAARVCGLRTVAEHVESEAVLDRLRAMGVDHVQGFLFHRPEPLCQLLAR